MTAGAFNGIKTFVPWPLSVLVAFIVKVAIAAPDVGALPNQFAATATVVRDDPENFKAALIVRPGKKAEWKGQAKEQKFGPELWALSERMVDEILAKGKYEGDV